MSHIYSSKLYICQDPRIARAYTAQNTKQAHFSLVSLSVYPRSRQCVRNGYGRARGVGAAPRRRRSNEAIWPKILVPRIAYSSSCRRYLRNMVERENGFEPIYIRLMCRPSTLKVRNISTAPHAITTKRRIRASTTGISRVLLDVSNVRLAAFLVLSHGILHNHSQFPMFYSFKPFRRQAKQLQFG